MSLVIGDEDDDKYWEETNSDSAVKASTELENVPVSDEDDDWIEL